MIKKEWLLCLTGALSNWNTRPGIVREVASDESIFTEAALDTLQSAHHRLWLVANSRTRRPTLHVLFVFKTFCERKWAQWQSRQTGDWISKWLSLRCDLYHVLHQVFASKNKTFLSQRHPENLHIGNIAGTWVFSFQVKIGAFSTNLFPATFRLWLGHHFIFPKLHSAFLTLDLVPLSPCQNLQANLLDFLKKLHGFPRCANIPILFVGDCHCPWRACQVDCELE